MIERDLYATVLSRAMRYYLYEMDQVLSGKADKTAFRLTPGRYEEAREAIATLFHVVKHPELEPAPRALAIGRAKRDAEFQRFMRTSLSPRKRRGN